MVENPFDFQYCRKDNGETVFLNGEKKKISNKEAHLSLQKLFDNIVVCKQGVITCRCTVKEQGAAHSHAVLCACIKPCNKRLMFVYMDSNNGSLDRPESYAPDARKQVIMLIETIRHRLIGHS